MSQAADKANQRNAVLAGFLGWMLDAFDFFVLTYVINDVARAFGVDRPAIALTLTLAMMMRPIGAIIFGLMADRYGRRLPLMINVCFFALLSVLSGLAPNYTTFLVLRMLFGAAMGGEWGVGASLALESAPAKWRGVISGLLQEGYAAGNLLAAIAYRTVYPTLGWRWMFFVGGLPALLAIFIRFKVKESDAWHEHKTDWPTYKKALFSHRRLFGYLVVLMTSMMFVSHGTQDLYPTFLQQERLFTPRQTADIAMITMVGAILGGIIFGYVSDRIGRKKTMIGAMGLCLLAMPMWIFAPSTPLLIVGGFLMQFGVQGAWGIVPAHLNELAPGMLRGFFPGFAYQLGAMFSASITYIEALVGEHFTYSQAMGIIAGTAFVLSAIMIKIGPENHRVSFRKDGT
jgi:SHS family lactate transporter-like MFS transporter